MATKITQAVIPCAGLGTRFLPVTKTVPKELLPLIDKPCLQIIVEEAVASGVEEFILVTSPQKKSLQEYFVPNHHLNEWLTQRNKSEQLQELKKLESMARFRMVFQDEPLGLGHAVLCAEQAISSDHFFVLLPDDLIDAEIPACKQMVNTFNHSQKSMVSVMQVTWDDVKNYGIVKASPLSDRTGLISQLVEKPSREEAPSNLAVIGRYILPQTIFSILRGQKPGAGGEIQLTDALQSLANGDGLVSYAFEGQRFDTGNPSGLLIAAINYALKDPRYAPSLRQHIKNLSTAL